MVSIPKSYDPNTFAGSLNAPQRQFAQTVNTTLGQLVDRANAALPVYANNAAALAGGLTVGAYYRTGADPDPVCVVH